MNFPCNSARILRPSLRQQALAGTQDQDERDKSLDLTVCGGPSASSGLKAQFACPPKPIGEGWAESIRVGLKIKY